MGDFKHKHSLGQNFLKDKNVLIKIIDSVDVMENDLIIEIGPGQGALTKYLKLYDSKLLCFEVDKRVEKYLNNYKDEKTTIIYEDFLKVDLKAILKSYKYENLYVIANLPYYITTPIIEKIIDSSLEVKAMVFMVQNEVADRLSAKPGTSNYGAMTVKLNYYYDVEKLFFVSRKSFIPVPKVDSAVIRLIKRNVLDVSDKDYFDRLVNAAFKMKRKNIKNNLHLYDLDIVERVLNKYNLNLQSRAEQIPLECFVELTNCLIEIDKD